MKFSFLAAELRFDFLGWRNERRKRNSNLFRWGNKQRMRNLNSSRWGNERGKRDPDVCGRRVQLPIPCGQVVFLGFQWSAWAIKPFSLSCKLGFDLKEGWDKKTFRGTSSSKIYRGKIRWRGQKNRLKYAWLQAFLYLHVHLWVLLPSNKQDSTTCIFK